MSDHSTFSTVRAACGECPFRATGGCTWGAYLFVSGAARPAPAQAATVVQPRPTGEGAAITPLVMRDLAERSVTGRLKYGTALRAGNGRDALTDAYQEALALVQYLRQALFERDGK